MAEAPSEEILRTLGSYIERKSKIRFKEIIIGWPEGSHKLVLPTLSLMIKTPRLIPQQAALLSLTTLENHTAEALYQVGEWNFSVQLDMWLKTSAQRFDAMQMISDIFYQAEERVSPAIIMNITNYHNTPATYFFVNSTIPDTGSSSLAQEWRAMVDINASCAQLVLRENEKVITQPAVLDFDIID